MQRLLSALVILSAGTSALGLSAFGQVTTSTSPNVSTGNGVVTPLSPMAVPGTSASNPFTSFDISYVDPTLQLLVVSSRSSKAVTIFDALLDRPIGETPAIFAGKGASNPVSGPNGVVIAGDEIWAGDYPSQVQVFSLRTGAKSPVFVTTIPTGGGLRADEIDYDPVDRIVGVTNGDTDPVAQPRPFLSLISKDTYKIEHQLYFDGTNGTPDATQGGLGSPFYDAQTGKFLVTIVQVGSNVTQGEVDVVDPVSGKLLNRFTGINNCQPSGMAEGPGENVLVSCDPGFPVDPAQFPPLEYVINGRTGAIVAKITQLGGADEVWYNAGDHRYYTGSRDFYNIADPSVATPVLGVINADTNKWIANVPTGTNAHSVAANPLNNHIFVPIVNPNPLCGELSGCIAVYGSTGLLAHLP